MRKFHAAGALVAAIVVGTSTLVGPAAADPPPPPADEPSEDEASEDAAEEQVDEAEEAAADEPSEDEVLEGMVQLTIAPQDTATFRHGPEAGTSSVILLCGLDDGSTHPTPEAACDSLRAAGGDFASLPPVEDVLCTLRFAPVEVRAVGLWEGQVVRYQATFSNRCAAEVETDNVFAF